MDIKKFKELEKTVKIINELEKLEFIFSRKGFSTCKFYTGKPSRELSVDFEVLKPILLKVIKDEISYYKEVFESM